MTNSSLKDRAVLVIGRRGGIAEAICRQARSQGANVVAAGRERDDLDRAYADNGITTETVDVTDESSVSALADRLGAVDHVVCTASARARGKAADLSFDTVALSIQTKVVGPIMLAKYLAARMPEEGSFVFMSGGTAPRPTLLSTPRNVRSQSSWRPSESTPSHPEPSTPAPAMRSARKEGRTLRGPQGAQPGQQGGQL